MTLKRIPADDRMWLIAELRDLLSGASSAPVFPIGPGPAPSGLKNIPDGAGLIIHTSGSTGTPKSVAISVDAIRASADATNEAIGGPGQWLVALPTHLISGIQMLTRSILGDHDPLFYDGAFKPKSFVERARALSSDRRYTSLVPIQLARLLEYAQENPQALAVLQRLDKILVGGQATPLQIRQRAYDLGLKLVRTYGMTETSSGVVYDGVEIGDAEVRIRDGEVQISGPMLAMEYIDNARLTAEKFIIDGGKRWFRTGDTGKLRGGTLEITGRLDRVVISGGVNVALDAVERIAGEDPLFADTVAVDLPDSEWGNRIVLVHQPGDEETLRRRMEQFESLGEKIKQQLGSAAVPRDLIDLPEIPRLAGEKPDAKAVREAVLEKLEES